jgi:hypothetical protein
MYIKMVLGDGVSGSFSEYRVKEAEKIMGGQVIDYETKIIYRQGIEQGIEQVITDILLRGKSPEEVSDLCGYPLEQVQTVANKLNIK